jgi:hypothetical protein
LPSIVGCFFRLAFRRGRRTLRSWDLLAGDGAGQLLDLALEKLAIRSSSRRIARASFAVSESWTFSASVSTMRSATQRRLGETRREG